MASVPLAWGTLLLMATGRRRPALAGAALLPAAAVLALNRSTLGFFRRTCGLGFCLRVVPLHFLYHLCNGVSVVLALLGGGRRTSATPGLHGTPEDPPSPP